MVAVIPFVALSIVNIKLDLNLEENYIKKLVYRAGQVEQPSNGTIIYYDKKIISTFLYKYD